MQNEREYDRDHDLLVRLDTKLDALASQFAEARVALSLKADAARVEKLETALEAMRNKVYAAGGGLAVLQVGLHWLLK